MWMAKATVTKDIPLGKSMIIKKGSTITITEGKNQDYAFWNGYGVWDIDKSYVKNISEKVKS